MLELEEEIDILPVHENSDTVNQTLINIRQELDALSQSESEYSVNHSYEICYFIPILLGLFFMVFKIIEYCNPNSSLSDIALLIVVVSLAAAIPNLLIAAIVTDGVTWIRELRKKRTFQYQSLMRKKAKLKGYLTEYTNKAKQLASDKLTENVFHEYLFNFDNRVNVIKKSYPEVFINSIKDTYDLEGIRNQIKTYYQNENALEFFTYYDTLATLDKNIEQLWKDYQKKDDVMLEKRYDDYIKNRKTEITSLL